MLILLLTACSGEGEGPSIAPQKPFGTVVSESASGVAHDVFDTARSPFEDLDVVETPIPERLKQISINPYQPPAEPLCIMVGRELAELDGLLGPDIDNPAANVSSSYTEQGIGIARSGASGMLRSRINIIPFQGVVRRVSGADSHARAVAHAYEAGKLRRAYLKGLGRAYRCAAVCGEPPFNCSTLR